jgi:hypothetical protein
MPEDTAMSFTICKDEGDDFNTVYHVRASISTRAEFEELIAKLTVRLETDFTTQGKTHDQRYLDSKPVHTGDAIPAGPSSTAGEAGANPRWEADFYRNSRD